MKPWQFLRRNFPVLVVSIAYLWAAVAIFSYRAKQAPPGTKVTLRIGHWQLEPGVRDGFNALAAEYQKLHPEVYIVQDAVPESTYSQWLTTQVMGGTASDIIEAGLLSPALLLSYHSRYFLPLNNYVNQPNPYNAGTALAGAPWRNTFKDGMRAGYIEELQAYMAVPLAQFAYRIVYNRDLYFKLTGRTTPPRDYRDFISICGQIQRQRDDHDRPYIPIAASSYHIGMWDSTMCEPLTFAALRQLDFNRDGTVGADEFFTGIATHRIGLDFPPFAARFQMLRELTQFMPVGVTGLSRDEAVFLFAQQRSVFITSGTWDAQSLREQARGTFDVGVLDFPLPARNDPEFGQILEGPVYDRTFAGMPFVITRTCKHPEVALDFLQFLTSQRGNTEFNRHIGWIPSIRGSEMPPALAGYEPHFEGVYGAMPLTLGGDTNVKWQQLLALFLINQIDYPAMTAQYLAYYRDHAPKEFAELQQDNQRVTIREEQLMAGLRARAMLEDAKNPTAAWIRYRQLETDRLLVRDLRPSLLAKLVSDGPVTNAPAPYEISPAALANVRRQLGGHR
ncbi:MAG: extracellular solute-binding protein [Verrucomicrobiota bacterium]